MILIICVTLFVLIWRSDYDLKILDIVNHERIGFLDKAFIFITDTAFIVAILIPTIIVAVAFLKNNEKMKRVGCQIYVALFTSTIITTTLKYVLNRTRPFVNNHSIEKLSSGGSPSFPSGHTADAFVIGVSVVILSDNRMKFIVPVWLWALAVGYSRMALGVHYPSDVVGSILIGTLCAIFGNWLFTKSIFRRKNNGIVS